MFFVSQLAGFNVVAAPTGFSPLNLSPYVWLQFSDISTLFTDSAGTNPVTSDADKIGKVSDKSGNNRHFTQATDNRRPSYETNILNSLAVAEFGAGPDVYTYWGGPDISALTEGEVFIVIKMEADPPSPANHGGLWKFGDSGDNVHFPFTDNNVYDDFGASARKSTGNPTLSVASWRLYNVVTTSSEWTSFVDGTQHYTTGTNTVDFTSAPVLGASFDSTTYYVVGQIAEFILFSAKLSAGDKTDLKAYFADRYALTIA